MALLDLVGAQLITDVVVDASTTWILARSYMPETPDKAVFLSEIGGRPSDQTPVEAYDFPSFQVIVRGGPEGYVEARSKIDEVIASLNNATISGLIYVFMRTAPIALGYDGNNRPKISVNFDTMKVRP